MKKTPVRITALFLCAVLALSLFSCSAEFPEYEYKDGKIVSENGDAFIPAPQGFQPCGIGEKCAVFGAFELHRVMDLDGNLLPADEWMTEEYGGDLSTVYYSEKIDLPDFREMDFDACYFCEEDANVVSLAAITDKELLRNIIGLLGSGKQIDYALLDGRIKETYRLKFYDDAFPALFYSLNYYVTDGGNFVFCRGLGICVNDAGLLSGYVPAENPVSAPEGV